MIGQAAFPQPSATDFWVFAGCVLFLASAYYLFLRIGNERRKSHEPSDPTRRILPDPIRTKAVDDDFVTWPKLEERMKKEQVNLDARFDASEKIFRDRFHKLDNDLNSIRLESVDWHDRATEQFQKIEGKLGKLDGTLEQTNAISVRTDQAVRALASDLPKQIADAVVRRRN